MTIVTCGINYKTADIALREQVFFTSDKLHFYLQDILTSNIASEVVLLSTCNRSELYCETNEPKLVMNWFSALHPAVKKVMYCYHGEMAVVHLMRVACGIDSMVLGEAEILGQLKLAFAESCSANAVSNPFHRLFQQVFSVAKELRSTTEIGACPVSIASAACSLIKQVLGATDPNVVLVGAGNIVELLLRYLQANFAHNTWIINRNIEKAYQLANTYGVSAGPLTELDNLLVTANVIITATRSLHPLITRSRLHNLLRLRSQPLYIFDIAVPRNVEASVAELSSVQLYCIDDLKNIVQANQQNRKHAAEKSLVAIEQKAKAFMAQYLSLQQVSSTIRAYRSQIESICEEELYKILHNLRYNTSNINKYYTEQILRDFSRALTQKLLHAPSVTLRQVGYEGRLDLLCWAKKLLAISELDSQVL